MGWPVGRNGLAAAALFVTRPAALPCPAPLTLRVCCVANTTNHQPTNQPPINQPPATSHQPPTTTNINKQIINETLPALHELQAQGLVHYIGITGLPFKALTYVLDRVPPGAFCARSL
jgi:hypothetical protein